MEDRPWGDSPTVAWVACPPNPFPGHPRSPEALETLEQPWAWSEESKASERRARATAQEIETEGAAQEPTPSPAEAWNAGFPPGEGHGWSKFIPGGQMFLAFDIGHPCPPLELTAPAHPESLLRTRLLRARGAWGTGPGHQGSGEPSGLVTASAAFLARLEGVGWGER